MANEFTEIKETEPAEIIAGDTLQWKRTDLNSDYANDTYTLSYVARLQGDGTTTFSITASASGSDYLVSVAHGTTANYSAGTYYWEAYITRDSDSARITIDSGTWLVKANRASATTDPRSHAKIMLDKLESMLQGKADSDVSSYSIQGRTLDKIPIEELMKWRNHYKAEYAAEVRKERALNGDNSGKHIRVKFL